jgi:hypothetical protein
LGQKLFLIGLGIAAGALLAAGAYFLYARFAGPGRGPVVDNVADLKARLDDDPASRFIYDPDLNYRLKPGFDGGKYYPDPPPHPTNSLGLVGRAELSRDPSVRKVVFLGDSVTYGERVAYADLFVTRMQKLAGKRDQLLNAGCPGWSTFQELRFFDRYLAKEDWALVVIVFCVNDLVKFEWRYDSSRAERASGDQLVAVETPLDAVRLKVLRAGFAGRPETEWLSKQHDGFLAAWDDGMWKKFREEVLQPLLVGKVRAPVAFVAVPNLYQVKAARRNAPPAETFYPQRQLESFCAANGMAFIDPSPALTDNPDPMTYFVDDTHFTPAGHEAVARFVWPKIAPLLKGVGPKAGSATP